MSPTSHIHHDTSGPADGAPIVFLHGGTISRKMWLPQLERLSEEFYLLAPDLPGHGTRAKEPFRLTEATRQVAALIDHEAEGRALLVGLSLGGLVAIDLAEQHPEKVAGLVLTGATQSHRLSPWFKWVARAMVAYAGLAQRLVGNRTRQLEIKTFQKQYPQVDAEAILSGGLHVQSYMDLIQELDRQDFPAKLARFPGPTLILNGEKDKDSRACEPDYLAAAQRGALEVLPQAGHMANLDQPEAYTARVRAFAETLSPLRAGQAS